MARSTDAIRKTATSVIARIKDEARSRGADTQVLITRYALERWLHRLSTGEHRGNFVLKGGMVMPLLGAGHRPTEDIDGHRDLEMTAEEVARFVEDVCSTEPTQEDGLEFDTAGMKIAEIREGLLPGSRVSFQAWLRPHAGNPTEIRVKLDLCYGDAITPGAVVETLPSTIKGFDPVSLPCFPWPTIISEKVHAISRHGADNSRVKDYYDIYLISRTVPVDGAELLAAVEATFERWGGAGPSPDLYGLTDAFAADKGPLWKSFLKRSRLKDEPPSFSAVVREVRAFILPVMEASAAGESYTATWDPACRWTPAVMPLEADIPAASQGRAPGG